MFHETTDAAIQSYFPNESNASGFLKLLSTWWTISNSKAQYLLHNYLRNAAVRGDNKPFLRVKAKWVQD